MISLNLSLICLELVCKNIPSSRISSKNRLMFNKSLLPVAGRRPPIAAPKTSPVPDGRFEDCDEPLDDPPGERSDVWSVPPPAGGVEVGGDVGEGVGEGFKQLQELMLTPPTFIWSFFR